MRSVIQLKFRLFRTSGTRASGLLDRSRCFALDHVWNCGRAVHQVDRDGRGLLCRMQLVISLRLQSVP